MIKVVKNFEIVPEILKREQRREAFKENIQNCKYCDESDKYKTDSVLNELKRIYNTKCAYCEKELLDSPKHIEHYRPKNIYYWLAYSWDNLLLACNACNSYKGIKFEIAGKKIKYLDEDFDDIHNLSTSYNVQEKPLLINPEIDDVSIDIQYDTQGIISSKTKNERVEYTINTACKLNRDGLIKKRQVIINNYRNTINRHYELFLKEDKTAISRFMPDIEIFLKQCVPSSEFFGLRNFILDNPEIFFEKTLANIVKMLTARIKKQ